MPALGVVPAGSTNVFTRALGLPNDPVEATGALLEALRAGSTPPGQPGPGRRPVVLFAAGLGFDAGVVAGVERHRRRGTRSTHTLYARVGGPALLRRGPAASPAARPACRRHGVDNVFFAIVANADPWTFAGNRPLRPTPDVTFDGGLGSTPGAG